MCMLGSHGSRASTPAAFWSCAALNPTPDAATATATCRDLSPPGDHFRRRKLTPLNQAFHQRKLDANRARVYLRTRSLENSSQSGLPHPKTCGFVVSGVRLLVNAGNPVLCRELTAIQDPQGKIRQPSLSGFLDSRRLRALIPSLNRS